MILIINLLIFIILSDHLYIDACRWSECTVKINETSFTGTYYWHYYTVKAYRAFMGIPYAEPPLGNLRFKPPQPITYNNTRYYVQSLGHQCMQEEDPKISRSEDCLFLNIYTPWPPAPDLAYNERKKLPVMFWIHGGSFNKGNGGWWLYGADYLVQQYVVLVTINYRLGVFGFLSAPEQGIYGNMGLKDQRMALEWVYNNIEHFEGDKENITIFGESAGAASVHYLLLDNSTRRFYKRAILQSGSALNPWALQFHAKKRYERLSQILSNNSKSNLTLSELQNNYTAKQLYEAQLKVPNDEDQRRATAPVFNPVIEHENSTNSIIKEQVLNLTETSFPDIELMIGWNSKEGILAMPRVDNDTNEIKNTLNDIERVIPRKYNIWRNVSANESQCAIKKLNETYKCTTHEYNSKECREIYLQLMGDAWFYHGIYRTINAIRKTSRTKNIYFYLLSDDGYSIYKKYVITNHTDIKGVAHADDLGFLFDMSGKFGLIIVTVRVPWAAYRSHKRMVHWWGNFAKTGDPNKRYFNESDYKIYHNEVRFQNIKTVWEPLKNNSLTAINIINNDTLRMVDLNVSNMIVWDEVLKKGNEVRKFMKNNSSELNSKKC